MKADYHVHSEFSDDSSEKMENQIERAAALGFDEICFTDHVDYGIKRDWDDPRGVEWRGSGDERMPCANVDCPVYFAELHRLKEKYSGIITVRSGLEFGIQTITVPDFEKLYEKWEKELDFVLLSMHQVDNLEFWTQDFQRGRTQQEYNEKYYDEIYRTIQMFHHYSVLAHLDLLSRYDEAGIYPFEKVRDQIAEILKLAIREGKGIEINTSSWKYGLPDTQPSRSILHLYKDLGGKIIAVGSDSHAAEWTGAHFDDAVGILRDEIGFHEICTFDHMRPVFHRI